MDLRRTMLFMPGNNPGMLQNGGVFGADALILDLEDAVAPQEKDAARLLVAQALKTVDYGMSEKVVRIIHWTLLPAGISKPSSPAVRTRY